MEKDGKVHQPNMINRVSHLLNLPLLQNIHNYLTGFSFLLERVLFDTVVILLEMPSPLHVPLQCIQDSNTIFFFSF